MFELELHQNASRCRENKVETSLWQNLPRAIPAHPSPFPIVLTGELEFFRFPEKAGMRALVEGGTRANCDYSRSMIVAPARAVGRWSIGSTRSRFSAAHAVIADFFPTHELENVSAAIAALIDLHLLFAAKAEARVPATSLRVVRIDPQRLVTAKRAANEISVVSPEKRFETSRTTEVFFV